MKIGLFTSGYQRNPLEDCFVDAKCFGYDFIELWGGRPHAYAPDLAAGDIEIVKALIDKYEMPVLTYTPEHNAYPFNYMIGSEAQWQDAVNYLRLAMDMGKAMGADFTLVSAGHAGYLASNREIKDRVIRTMRELSSHAEKIGHRLVLEALTPYESNTIKSANDLAEVVEMVDSSWLYGMCDIVPPFVQNESMMAYFAKLGDRMQHLHIVDSDGSSDTHVLPGDGRIPLPELMAEIKACGYQGTATIELVTAYINEPRLYARRAIDNLRKMMT